MRTITLFALLLTIQLANAQFKADNVKYTNVFPQELCRTLQSNPGYVLLDVRSQGEYDDTLSGSPGLNMGRIKGAMHMDIRQLPARWRELQQYKDKPLFIYCSHSQRSRRASRLLADSGFTKVFNVDGGLTNFYIQGITADSCAAYAVTTSLPYKLVSAPQLFNHHASWFFLDIREDSSFNGTGRSAYTKTLGRFRAATHIPLSKLSASLASIPTDKPVLIIDEFGAASPQAARLLLDKGYKDVSILFNGLDAWLDYKLEYSIYKSGQMPDWTPTPGVDYRILSADMFDHEMKSGKPKPVLVDVRSKEEFTNTSKNYWQNIGQVKGAVNIPAAQLPMSGSLLPSSKKAPIIIYGFNSQDEIYDAVTTLRDQGYTNVAVLRGGIWNLRWSSHNVKGKKYLNDWVINVPDENL
jgi:rhodanese-related sulfurtransferase